MGLYTTQDDIQKITEAMAGWTIVKFDTHGEILEFELVKGQQKRLFKLGCTDLGVWIDAILDMKFNDCFIFHSYKDFKEGLLDQDISEFLFEDRQNTKYVGYVKFGKKYLVEVDKVEAHDRGFLFEGPDYDALALCLRSGEKYILEHLELALRNAEYDPDWDDFFCHDLGDRQELFFEMYFPDHKL